MIKSELVYCNIQHARPFWLVFLVIISVALAVLYACEVITFAGLGMWVYIIGVGVVFALLVLVIRGGVWRLAVDSQTVEWETPFSGGQIVALKDVRCLRIVSRGVGAGRGGGAGPKPVDDYYLIMNDHAEFHLSLTCIGDESEFIRCMMPLVRVVDDS